MLAIELHILEKCNRKDNCLFTSILQNIFFCIQQKKETRAGL